jgi:hypothetical protein
MDVYDFIDAVQGNVIGLWVRTLETSDRARFKVKIRALAQTNFDIASKTKLLQGPIYKHIYKLQDSPADNATASAVPGTYRQRQGIHVARRCHGAELQDNSGNRAD